MKFRVKTPWNDSFPSQTLPSTSVPKKTALIEVFRVKESLNTQVYVDLMLLTEWNVLWKYSEREAEPLPSEKASIESVFEDFRAMKGGFAQANRISLKRSDVSTPHQLAKLGRP
ncbi:hypothetical protein RJT34_23569 [Clitoria ternatea]|uniref:Uncharacterized protein n=1 Tax=Clitoria ternatea TaxID=43366 RepID=A0AAN9FMX1_CLITE